MYKSASKFAQHRRELSNRTESARKGLRERTKLSGPMVLTKKLRKQLGEGLANEDKFLLEVNSAIRTMVRSGFKHPAEQAATLNRMRKRTALGQQWTMDLVLAFYSRMDERKR
jgi:hypothetical protein